jgi:DNA-binding MarR family transcriptional regulator
MFLSRRGDLVTTQKDVAANFEISAAAVAVSVRKLEADGLINRIADEHDNRSNVITLTERGSEIVEKTKNLISDIDEAMFEGFDDDEIVQFSAYLSRLCDNIRDYGKK